MEIYRVSFIGHRTLYNTKDVECALEEIISDLIRDREYVEFYVGRNGDFDISVASAVKRAQKKYGKENSSLILVLPYRVKDEYLLSEFYDDINLPVDKKTHFKLAISKRNEWLVDNSDLLVAYVEREYGGAYTTMKYAKKQVKNIINIWDLINIK